MANIDDKRRKTVLNEWIDEIKASRGLIENDSLEKTGLVPVRNEILSRLEEILAYAESKKPGFDPIDDVVCVPAIISPDRRQAVRRGAEADMSADADTAAVGAIVGDRRRGFGRIYIHRRKDD